jgi:O-antigen/teichoic acid export membrane protein
VVAVSREHASDAADGAAAADAVEVATGNVLEEEPAPRPPRVKASSKSHTRGSALLLIGRVLGMALGLVIQLLLVRILTKDDYGAFAWALSIVTLVQSIIPLGLDRIDSRFLALYDEKGDDRKIVGVLVTEAAIVVGLGSIVFVAVLLWHRSLSPGIAPSETAAQILVLTVLLAPLAALDAMVMNTFATFAKARAVFFRRYLLEPGLRLTAILVTYLLGASVFGLTVAYVVAAVVGLTIYLVMLLRLLITTGVLEGMGGRGPDLPVRALLREGFPMITSNLTYVVVISLPTIVLGAVATADAVASLRAVQPIATLAMAASGAFWILYPPLAARQWSQGDMHSLRLSYWRTALWVALASYPTLLLSTGFAEPTVTTLLGDRYASSAELLVITGLGFWFQSATGFSAIMMATAGRLRSLFWSNIVTLAVGVGLSFWLIPPYGAWGAAVSMSVALIVSNVIRQLLLRGLPTRVADTAVALPYTAMAIGLLASFAVQALLGLGFLAALVVSALISLAVLAVSVPYLDVPHTFPELLRIPVAGQVLRRLSRPSRRPSRNPYRTEPSAPAQPQPASVAVEPIDPRHGDTLFLLPEVGAGTRIGPLALDEVAAAVAAAPPGGIVVVLAPTRAPLRATVRDLEQSGLVDVRLFWEAPRRSRRTMLVPLDSREAVLAALARNEGSGRGRLLAAAAHVLVRLGLTRVVARDRVAVGRRG